MGESYLYYENWATSFFSVEGERDVFFQKNDENHEKKLIAIMASWFNFTYCVQISETLDEKLKKNEKFPTAPLTQKK